jgi:hypothetical protein
VLKKKKKISAGGSVAAKVSSQDEIIALSEECAINLCWGHECNAACVVRQ